MLSKLMILSIKSFTIYKLLLHFIVTHVDNGDLTP